MRIVWTHTAKRTFQKILDYLFSHWTSRELKNFIEETNDTLDHIKDNPNQFKASKINKKVRKGYINKLISIFYRVHPRKKEIQLLRFWDNRQNPKRTKL